MEKPQIKQYQDNLYALTHIKTHTLLKTANNDIKQITKDFFQITFLLTIFSLIFCMQTIYITKIGTPRLQNNGPSFR